MNCAELRSDIDRLKEELQALDEGISAMRGTEAGGKEMRGVIGLVDSDSADLALKKYLKDT